MTSKKKKELIECALFVEITDLAIFSFLPLTHMRSHMTRSKISWITFWKLKQFDWYFWIFKRESNIIWIFTFIWVSCDVIKNTRNLILKIYFPNLSKKVTWVVFKASVNNYYLFKIWVAGEPLGLRGLAIFAKTLIIFNYHTWLAKS